MPLFEGITTQGLGTFSFPLETTAVHNIRATLQLPNVVPSATQGSGAGAGTGTGGGAQVSSQVVATVSRNSTVIYTGQAGASGFSILGANFTAGDVVNVTLSSSLPQDQQPNAVKMTIAISKGSI
jgi:hypothetical protein